MGLGPQRLRPARPRRQGRPRCTDQGRRQVGLGGRVQRFAPLLRDRRRRPAVRLGLQRLRPAGRRRQGRAPRAGRRRRDRLVARLPRTTRLHGHQGRRLPLGLGLQRQRADRPAGRTTRTTPRRRGSGRRRAGGTSPAAPYHTIAVDHGRQVRRLRRQPVRADRARLPAVPSEPGADGHRGRVGAGRRQPDPRRGRARPTARSGPGATTTTAPARLRRRPGAPAQVGVDTDWKSASAGAYTDGGFTDGDQDERHAVDVGRQRRRSARPRRHGRRAACRRRSGPPRAGRRSPAATASASRGRTDDARPGLHAGRPRTGASRATARCGPGAPTTTGSSATATTGRPHRRRRQVGAAPTGRRSPRATTTAPRLKTDGTLWTGAAASSASSVTVGTPGEHRGRCADQVITGSGGHLHRLRLRQRPRLQLHARGQDGRHAVGLGQRTTPASSARARTRARTFLSPVRVDGATDWQNVACGGSYGDNFSIADEGQRPPVDLGRQLPRHSWATATT